MCYHSAFCILIFYIKFINIHGCSRTKTTNHKLKSGPMCQRFFLFVTEQLRERSSSRSRILLLQETNRLLLVASSGVSQLLWVQSL